MQTLEKNIENDLTPVEIAFVNEYVKDYNATRAYKAVKPNVKDETANSKGCTWVAKRSIAEAIRVRSEKRSVTSSRKHSKGNVLDRFDRLADKSEAKSQYSNAINAVDKIAKIQGLYEQKDDGGNYATFIQQIFNGPTQINTDSSSKDED